MIDRRELEDILNAMNDAQKTKLAYSFIQDKQGFVSSAYIKKYGNIGEVLFSYLRSKTKGITPDRAETIITLVLDGVYDIITQIKNADTRELSGEMKKMAVKEAHRQYMMSNSLLRIEGKDVYSQNLRTHPDAKVIKEEDDYLVLQADTKTFQISKKEFKRKYNW